MVSNSKGIGDVKNHLIQKFPIAKLTNVVSPVIEESTKPASPVIVRQSEISAEKSGFWLASLPKSQDTKKYEEIYKNLDDQSKEKFDNLQQEDKDIISKIFNNGIVPSFCSYTILDAGHGSSDCFYDYGEYSDSSDDMQNQENTILSNLIEIFQNDIYSDLKDYYTQNANNVDLKIDILANCQVSDLKNYLNKTHLTSDSFFQTDRNFERIMLAIKQNKFESEEIKDQVKENLFELSVDENLKSRYLSENDINAIIKFLTNKNEKIGGDTVNSKMEILKQLKLFGNKMFSEYNVEDNLNIFNTFVDLIPQDEHFEDYKDKIIGCVNTYTEYSYTASNFLKLFLMPNIDKIKTKDYKKILDIMTKCPYNTLKHDLYSELIFNDKYKDVSASRLRLIYINSRGNDFDTLYDQYLPMLQKADDDTISKMKPSMMLKLYQLYEFFKEIQVNGEEISLNRLPFQKLKELQLLLIKNNFSNLFKNIDISFISDKFDKVFIKNDGIIDYDGTLFEVNKLLAIKHLDLSQTQKGSIKNILSVKNNLANIDFKKIKIEKTGDFQNLQSKIKAILAEDNSISEENKKIILGRLTNDIDSIMFNKLPSDLENLEDCEVMKSIRSEIEKYLSFKTVEDEENTYIIGNARISGIDTNAKSALESIFKAIPELVVLLGIKQDGHGFDIGKHILAVGQEVVKDDNFKTLDENNQKLVLIAALMHDIAKVEGGQDPTHPQRGGQYAYKMLSGALNEDEKATVANLIFNHHFGEFIGKGEKNDEQMYILAYECKDDNPKFIDMLEILGKADLLGEDENYVSSKEEYINKIPQRIEFLKEKIKTINDVITKLKRDLALTPFPQEVIKMIDGRQNESDLMKECKQNGIVGEYEAAGVKIPKIDLAKMKDIESSKQGKYLKCLGFKDVKYGQIEFLIHAIKDGRQVKGIDYLTSHFKSDATLSTSIITMANTKTFQDREYGFIMEPDKTSIMSAATSNISSGYGKGRNQSGKYINKTETQYAQYDEYCELLNYLNVSKISPREEHSELITIDNKVAAIFVKEGCEKDMPIELVKYAKENNLALIVVPMTKYNAE